VLSLVGVVLLIALTIDGLALDGNGFTWIKIVFFTWMPRPFPGEGDNLEWAEQKRAEMLAGRRKRHRDGPPSGGHAHALPDPSRELGRPPDTPEEDGRSLRESLPIEARLDERDETVLMSWLEKTGHQEDAWATKLIGRKRSQVEPKMGTKG